MTDTKQKSAEEMAETYLKATRRPTQGPCLVPRDGAEVPPCHENDFCECEVKSAFLAGWRARDEEVADDATRKRLLKELCQEWNEDCEEGCDSYGHEKECKSTNLANAKRALREERDQLRAEVEKLRKVVEKLK